MSVGGINNIIEFTYFDTKVKDLALETLILGMFFMNKAAMPGET